MSDTGIDTGLRILTGRRVASSPSDRFNRERTFILIIPLKVFECSENIFTGSVSGHDFIIGSTFDKQNVSVSHYNLISLDYVPVTLRRSALVTGVATDFN
jgi:hypothetical protein